MDWSIVANNAAIQKTAEALRKRGIDAIIAQNGSEAKAAALKAIPKGAEVFAATSETLESIGLTREINQSGNYNSVRNRLNSMDRNREPMEMNRLGSAPDWVVGSVHAVTLDGKVVIVSATGSQLPAYAYGAMHVIWVVGAQKIVGSVDSAAERIRDYVLPLENERVKKAYKMPGSAINKTLIIEGERPGRITMIIVREKLGF